uniref:B9 domain-containing protein 1 n=1 Tax=Panagrellus redivivus TaxID=6233 RepID=A0A7E4VUR9_PANRE
MPPPMPSSSADPKSKFLVLVTGEIAYAEMTSTSTMYCKYFFNYGPDWRFLSGIEEGISLTATRARHHNRIVLNTQIEATFQSTNPFRWPQLVVACYGPDAFGNDVIRGYGSTHLPTVPGKTERKIPVFTPVASTVMHKLIGFFTGRRAEYVDPRIVATSEGREVTRVQTEGLITANFNVIIKDLKKYGYDCVPQSMSQASEATMPLFPDEDKPAQKYSPPPQDMPTSSVQVHYEEPEEYRPITTESDPPSNVEPYDSDQQNVHPLDEND